MNKEIRGSVFNSHRRSPFQKEAPSACLNHPNFITFLTNLDRQISYSQMKTWLGLLSLLIALSFSGVARAASDDAIKATCTQRIQSLYGLTLDPSKLSLQALTEIEARLAVCFRLRQKLRLIYDYRTTSLAFLQDLESRWDACERIKRNYNIVLRHDYYTASALADLEGRIATASRIYKTYGHNVSWRDSSLQHLQATERQFAATQPPLPKPHSQPLAETAIAFSSSTAIPYYASHSSPQRSSDSQSYASASPTPFLYSSPNPSASPTSRVVSRVRSGPVFYNTDYGFNYNYGYGYNGYTGYNYGYGYPSSPVPIMISIGSGR